jgi:hypothetical protein
VGICTLLLGTQNLGSSPNHSIMSNKLHTIGFGILSLVFMIAVPVMCYMQGQKDGFDKGVKAERKFWEDDARNEPYLHQSEKSFFKIHSYFKKD